MVNVQITFFLLSLCPGPYALLPTGRYDANYGPPARPLRSGQLSCPFIL
jgi:hypothetical protein